MAETFELGGREWPLRPKVPYPLLRRAVLELRGATGDTGEQIVLMEEMLAGAVAKQEREAFRAFLVEVPEDDDHVFDKEDLLRVFLEVVGMVAKTPFQPPSESADSSNQRNTDSTSEADLHSTESTLPPLVLTTQ